MEDRVKTQFCPPIYTACEMWSKTELTDVDEIHIPFFVPLSSSAPIIISLNDKK